MFHLCTYRFGTYGMKSSLSIHVWKFSHLNHLFSSSSSSWRALTQFLTVNPNSYEFINSQRNVIHGRLNSCFVHVFSVSLQHIQRVSLTMFNDQPSRFRTNTLHDIEKFIESFWTKSYVDAAHSFRILIVNLAKTSFDQLRLWLYLIFDHEYIYKIMVLAASSNVRFQAKYFYLKIIRTL